MNKESDFYISEDKKNKIIRFAKFRARWNTIIIIFSILLLILPIGYLSTIIYYSINNKANNEILTLETVYSLTKPNLNIDDDKVQSEFNPFFGFSISAPINKQVGSNNLTVGEYKSDIGFGVKKTSTVDLTIQPIPMDLREKEFAFVPPTQSAPFNLKSSWDNLNQIPSGTVSEVFLSLDKAYKSKTIEDIVSKYDVKILWNAVDTGVEKTMEDSNGTVVTPIGYPEKNTSPTNSHFTAKNSQELFIEQLKYLNEQNNLTENIMGESSIAAKERLKYINKNGVNIYGVVITGPSKEILKMKELKEIRGMYIGKVDFWNWNE
ncbi:anti-sigma factor C-terminal domain-containing protein [Priestia sp. LL-8]|uniref:anti-sigma factor C-terminal domain-containing protein n=1 Tax=Priestia sp. LL-8 TaxID=3110068 RepID=UPI002E25C23C|nr:anti-sigma factor C-terminal domain-containing protein [Priestia sp. LL-8]